MRSALVLGATGFVGGYLVNELLVSKKYDRITTLIRTASLEPHPVLEQTVFDFQDYSCLDDLLPVRDIFCCLGTTIQTAGSKKAFRFVDFELPLRFAQWAENTGAEFYANIFVIAESEIENNVIWVGSDDGLIHVSKDAGQTWENVTPPETMSPKLNMINSIDISLFKKGKAYVAATSYKFGDYRPYLYKTEDYGKNWTLITNGIKSNYYTRVIRSDKKREGLLYSGTEWGMYISFDDGNSWKPFQLNLPITSIRDLKIKDNDLIVATHGRSFWIIDDLTPLHQLNDDVLLSESYLYKPDISYRMQQSGGWGRSNNLLNGVNHPNGVIINYTLKKFNENDYVKIDIIDNNNNTLVRSFTNNKEKLLSLFGKERTMKEIRDYLNLEFFPRSGGGIGMTRLIRSMKMEGLL